MLNGGGWLALALVNAGLAEQKNRSRLTWFFVSLFFGPLATFLIVTWQRAPVDPIEVLHPFTNRRDRWLVLGTLAILLALFLGFLAVVGALWYSGAGAIVSFALGLVALVLYGRESAAARRE
jgi:archaellum biogenesis protein FlaJ (TadC family)